MLYRRVPEPTRTARRRLTALGVATALILGAGCTNPDTSDDDAAAAAATATAMVDAAAELAGITAPPTVALLSGNDALGAPDVG